MENGSNGRVSVPVPVGPPIAGMGRGQLLRRMMEVSRNGLSKASLSWSTSSEPRFTMKSTTTTEMTAKFMELESRFRGRNLLQSEKKPEPELTPSIIPGSAHEESEKTCSTPIPSSNEKKSDPSISTPLKKSDPSILTPPITPGSAHEESEKTCSTPIPSSDEKKSDPSILTPSKKSDLSILTPPITPGSAHEESEKTCSTPIPSSNEKKSESELTPSTRPAWDIELGWFFFPDWATTTVSVQSLMDQLTQIPFNLESVINTTEPYRTHHWLSIRLAIIRLLADSGNVTEALAICEEGLELLSNCPTSEDKTENELITGYLFSFKLIKVQMLALAQRTDEAQNMFNVVIPHKPRPWTLRYICASLFMHLGISGCRIALNALRGHMTTYDPQSVPPEEIKFFFLKARIYGRYKYLVQLKSPEWEAELKIMKALRTISVEMDMYYTQLLRQYNYRIYQENREYSGLEFDGTGCEMRWRNEFILSNLKKVLIPRFLEMKSVKHLAWALEELIMCPKHDYEEELVYKFVEETITEALNIEFSPYLNRVAAMFMEKTRVMGEETNPQTILDMIEIAASVGCPYAQLEVIGHKYRYDPKFKPDFEPIKLADIDVYKALFTAIVKSKHARNKPLARQQIETYFSKWPNSPSLLAILPRFVQLAEPISAIRVICGNTDYYSMSEGTPNNHTFLYDTLDIHDEILRLQRNRLFRSQKYFKKAALRKKAYCVTPSRFFKYN